MKTNKLSNTAVNMYLQCGLCYKAHYIDGWRPIKTKSALIFGKILDGALNILLEDQDLEKSLDYFHDEWFSIDKNLIEWSKNDIDFELLINTHVNLLHINHKEHSTLYLKGCMFIRAYYNQVLPKIKEVIAVQKPVSLKNNDGDEIVGFLDAIIQTTDGKIHLIDNKSSSYKYEEDSAKNSQQLVLYHYLTKDEYKYNDVGFIVLLKKINKNKVKTCKTCGTINQSTHKTCNKQIDNTRCNGEFSIVINPTVDIQYIFNKVSEEDEERVLNDFDNANNGIMNQIFEKGPPSKYGKCTYFDIHELNDTTNFYKKEEK